MWARLGSDVTILEALDDFLPAADRSVAGEALKTLTRQGLGIRLGARVTGARPHASGVSVDYEDAGARHECEFDRLVVAVGRRANTEGLDPAAAGVALDGHGRIVVDEHCRTSAEGVWAVGDAVTGPMLAHKASEEGAAVAERIAGHAAHVDHGIIPWVIYTHPEIAWVGRTEAEIDAAGVEHRNGSFPFAASGRAQASGETGGVVKVIADAATDRILGVHIFAANASELIAEAVVAMAFDASAEDIARTIHATPPSRRHCTKPPWRPTGGRYTSDAGSGPMQSTSPFVPDIPRPKSRIPMDLSARQRPRTRHRQPVSRADAPILVIAADSPTAQGLEAELDFYLGGRTEIRRFPDWETLPYDLLSPHQDIVSERLQAIGRLPSLAPGVMVTTVSTAMTRIAPPGFRRGPPVPDRARRPPGHRHVRQRLDGLDTPVSAR